MNEQTRKDMEKSVEVFIGRAEEELRESIAYLADGEVILSLMRLQHGFQCLKLADAYLGGELSE